MNRSFTVMVLIVTETAVFTTTVQCTATSFNDAACRAVADVENRSRNWPISRYQDLINVQPLAVSLVATHNAPPFLPGFDN